MTWPVKNILSAYSAERKATTTTKTKEINTVHWIGELFQRHLRLSTYLFVTLLAYKYTWPFEQASKGWSFDWMAIIIGRNLGLMMVAVGGWHWFLYDRVSPSPSSWKNKFNLKNQYDNVHVHLKREQLYTTFGFLMSSMYEIIIIRLWSTKSSWIQPCYHNFWSFPIWSIFHVLIVAYWRDFHFYLCHRVMHPWRYKLFGIDPGQWMYKHVHSLHHKSHNPGPWSGLSMHPVEHLLYYSCTLLNVFFVLHPIHFLFNKFHADLSPIAGHDGHDKPVGGGSLFHYLHHAHFECNYGTPMVP